jgi:outer membrane protein assembly factor BamD (BamD/ComL family)
LFHDFIAKRLKPISRELINFKTGPDKLLLKAQKLLKDGRLDEAVIIWEQIYSDEEKSNYARSISAYNIAIMKAMDKDYEQAIIYFNRSDELEELSDKEIVRF